METDVKYQAQDLISALFKVKKYQSNNYEELYKDLQGQYIMLNMSRTNLIIDNNRKTPVSESLF